ncbi:MAG: hypothetical protein E7311_00800 [Clostridiales bacterium]|nr:hypothetical protein [Clostridiales bacterium]
MNNINIWKKKSFLISVIITIIILLSIFFIIYVNSNSYKMKQYLKQNYTSYAEFDNHGYILVKKEDKYGIIDYDKNEIFKCIYDNASFMEYRNTYLIILSDTENNILLNNNLEEIAKSNNDILVYIDEGYAQTWNDNQFKLISIDNKELIAKGIIDINKNTIEYLFNNGYKLISYRNKITDQDGVETEINLSALKNENNETIYDNVSINVFNDKFLLLKDEKGYKLIDFYGKDVTIYYSNNIQCQNGEIYLVNEKTNGIAKLKIIKNENGYDVVKEKV